GHALAPRGSDASGQGEHFRGEPGGVARRPDRGEGDREARREPRAVGGEARFRPDAVEQLRGPALQLAGRRVRADERLGVGLEKGDVGARRGDRDLDGQDPLRGQGFHDAADQRRLAVAARGDEEDLLSFGEIAFEPVALDLAIGERRRGHHFPVDERIARTHYVIIRNGYVESRSGGGLGERRGGDVGTRVLGRGAAEQQRQRRGEERGDRTHRGLLLDARRQFNREHAGARGRGEQRDDQRRAGGLAPA